jgi:hypothetical protein
MRTICDQVNGRFSLIGGLLLQKNRSQKGISVRSVRLGWAEGGGHLRARRLTESFELGADDISGLAIKH